MKNSKLVNKELRVSYAQAVHDLDEEKRILKVVREHRTNMGIETAEFEGNVAKAFGKKFGLMVNSGSSANLLAFELLDLPKGSEVITPVLTFSTTIAPMIQKGLIPVFTDVEEGTYVINIDQIEKLITKKTKAICVPLLLGNVPNMKELASLAKKYNLYLIEDSCDTMGALYNDKPTGTYSDISTTSFFGSHIITAGGNGGMILVNNKTWADKIRVMRGWGRSSALFKESEDIKLRFKAQIGAIQYDAKFIFGDIGYNFLPSEIGAAFGNAQIAKLPKFRKIREHNYQYLLKFFSQYEKYLILPKQGTNVETQWLAFPLTLTENAPFTRLELATYLEKNNIQTRVIFTGNILKQPGFKDIEHRGLRSYPVADTVMQRGLLIGCHHGMRKEHLEKLANTFTEFFNTIKKS